MIIIPTYNERNNIEPLVKRIRSAAGRVPILFIDDNSPDGTAELIRRLQQTDPAIHLMVRPTKAGLGSAYREAFKKVAREGRADFIITMDADLSHPPESIPMIIEQLKQYPVVVGSRYVAGGNVKNWNRRRRLISWWANRYARLLTGVTVFDLTAGFVGCSVEWLRKIDLERLDEDGYAFLVQLKYLLHRAGAHIHEHPITFTERREGKSKLSGAIVAEGAVFPLKVFISRFFVNQTVDKSNSEISKNV